MRDSCMLPCSPTARRNRRPNSRSVMLCSVFGVFGDPMFDDPMFRSVFSCCSSHTNVSDCQSSTRLATSGVILQLIVTQPQFGQFACLQCLLDGFGHARDVPDVERA